jgi:O-antigen ligase
MINKIKNINKNLLLTLGLFIFSFSISAYYIGGNMLKYLTLAGGILLVVWTAYIKPRKISLGLIIFVAVYYGLFLLKSATLWQNTLQSVNIIFGIIDCCLLLCGYAISINANQVLPIKKQENKIFLLILLVTVMGIFVYFRVQQEMIDNTSTRIAILSEDDSVNPIGFAYVNALIFLIIYFMRNTFRLSIITKTLSLFVMVAVIISLLSTGTRGVTIYLAIIIILFELRKVKIINAIKFVFKTVLILSAGIILINIAMRYNATINSMLTSYFYRFNNLFNSGYDNVIDPSTLARLSFIEDFKREWQDYFLWGQPNYVPYPHNIAIELIQRFGLVYAIPLLVLFYKVLKKAGVIYFSKENTYATLFSMIFLLSLLQGFSSMSMEMNRGLWLSAGYLLGYRINESSKTTIRSKT